MKIKNNTLVLDFGKSKHKNIFYQMTLQPSISVYCHKNDT